MAGGERAMASESGARGHVSPLAPKGGFPDLPMVRGAELSAASAGIKAPGRLDVMLARAAEGSSVAGLFTTSATRGAPVLDCQEKMASAEGPGGFALVANSGNANAFTGSHGARAVSELTGEVSGLLGIPGSHVYFASTGVIGEPLPKERISGCLRELEAGLGAGNHEAAARAIMTTDTYPKGAGAALSIGGHEARIAGIAKGSGMIAPDMATMLAFIFTDAAVERGAWREMVADANAETFNCVTVDGDTSTSDMVLAFATGRSGMPEICNPESGEGRRLRDSLHGVMRDLALQIARDGEGASKLAEILVTGAASDSDARLAARSIANSPLVKTAIAGEDPNWGRIVMAVGKSGARADRDLLSIWLGDILVAEKGWVSPGYSEELGAGYMRRQEILIRADLGIGGGSARVWTCDLTHQYVTINSDYRS